MYKKMLVPLDGSKLSEVVFPYARELAGRLNLEAILLHVISPEEQEKAHLYQSYIEHKVDVLKCQSEEMVEKVSAGATCKPVKVRGEITSGYPAEEILDYAENSKVDFILIATHGRSGIRRWVIGSVAEKVLRASKVPVWLVRAAVPEEIANDKWPKKTVLVTLDGSRPAEEVLPHVETLAKQWGTKLVDVVLLAVSAPLVKSGYYIPDTLMKPEELKEYLSKVAKRLKDAGLNVRLEVRKGRPAEEIINYANANSFNLIFMSTHGASGLEKWVFGSVADKVLHEASSPIFLVRPQYGV